MSDDVKRISPLEGFFATMEAMKDQAIYGRTPGRNDVFRDEWDAIVVDTVQAYDTGRWETAIERNGDGNWIIVQQYEDREHAESGHASWVEAMHADPSRELRDLDLWGLGPEPSSD